jgi:hypothetical protein
MNAVNGGFLQRVQVPGYRLVAMSIILRSKIRNALHPRFAPTGCRPRRIEYISRVQGQGLPRACASFSVLRQAARSRSIGNLPYISCRARLACKKDIAVLYVIRASTYDLFSIEYSNTAPSPQLP